ncbi:cytochrome c/FTR1 family iron permease [uncultured Microbulbifer sp.]|uniref:cytochrome c/FTR1 family iron permease n=1 Tax=uncultured Microbulbifer sp. TaxID=348147 RepID=UPI002601390F|nr:cytochrome c/FTR1 family iron permease [uncultured Microbulbifer sp.]
MRYVFQILSTLLLAGSLIANTVAAPADPLELRQLMQMAEYIGVDYSEAVVDGKIVNNDEYAEMQEFSQLLLDRGRALPASGKSAAIERQTKALKLAIDNKAGLAEVQKHTAALRQSLLEISPQLSLPSKLLPTEETAAIYQQQCVSCHGVEGKGDGALAAQLEPPPTDFHDRERADNRSLLGLYDAISSGIDGTGMTAFKALDDQQRWSLAFYVGGKAFAGADAPQGTGAITLNDLVQYSPNVLKSNKAEIRDEQIAALRANPASLFTASKGGASSIDVARSQLEAAQAAYNAGDYSDARTLAISAYLDGFELAESSLNSHDSALRLSIERDLLALRGQLNADSDPAEVTSNFQAIFDRLDQAKELIEGGSLSSGALFLASLIILLREGLEALLVVIALSTVLIKTERRDAIKYVHFGWIAAFAAGFATWLAAQNLVTISGASREIMEGVAAAVAAAVLFYVGFWMHSKTQAHEWQRYIHDNINKHLGAGTLWGIAGLSFIAVYREIFETILFYQALLSQTTAGQESSLWGGLLTGVALLVVFGWLMVRFSKRLPIGKFFSATTFILLALSFILAGKAIAALQEAALISMTSLPVDFSFDWLGIYSTWEGISVQTIILIVSLYLLLKERHTGGQAAPSKTAG